MGACVSQPSTRNSGKLFPGVRATQSAEPSVIVLRPPVAGTPLAPPSPTRRAQKSPRSTPPAQPISLRSLECEPTSASAAELANLHSVAAAAAAAEANAAAAAISLQLALVDFDKPITSPTPSSVVATETVEPVRRMLSASSVTPPPYAPYVDEDAPAHAPVPMVF